MREVSGPSLTEGGSLYEDLIAMKRGGSSYQYLFDGLGSVSEVVDDSEATQNSYRYEAFGQIESSTSTVSNPYAYVGAYGVHRDPEPSLYFMQARYYKAGIGRFVSKDPAVGELRHPRSLSRYAYAVSRPTKYVDPRGTSILPAPIRKWPIPIPIAVPRLPLESPLIECILISHTMNERIGDWVNGPIGADFDKWQHCMMTCIITASCGTWIGHPIAHATERWEYIPYFPYTADSEADEIANIKGYEIGRCFKHPPGPNLFTDCDAGCTQAGYSPNPQF